MRIELLYIDECPNWELTLHLLRSVLDSTGHADVPITAELIDSEASAGRWEFAGSPSVLVDGVDLVPSDGPIRSLACRLYITPDGPAGHPTRRQLEEAIIAHASEVRGGR